MDQNDVKFAEEALGSFICSSINRVSESGVLSHKYRLTEMEIKEATNRQRLKQTVIDDYVAYFADHDVVAEYKEVSETITLRLDLSDCVLNARQARDLATAMSHYRAEHG